MKIEKVLFIEDSIEKYMEVYRYLKKQGIDIIEHARNAEDALDSVEEAIRDKAPFDLVISDMHFDYFGSDTFKTWEIGRASCRERV